MAVESEVARRGIETYLLAELAPVQRQHPPLSSRRNFGRPESAGQLPRGEIRISQICSRRCKLNSGCFDATIARARGGLTVDGEKCFEKKLGFIGEISSLERLFGRVTFAVSVSPRR